MANPHAFLLLLLAIQTSIVNSLKRICCTKLLRHDQISSVMYVSEFATEVSRLSLFSAVTFDCSLIANSSYMELKLG